MYPDQRLTAATAFSCTLWFASVRSAASKLPSLIRSVPKIAVSLRRVSEVLTPPPGPEPDWLSDQACSDLDHINAEHCMTAAGGGMPAKPGLGALQSVVSDGDQPQYSTAPSSPTTGDDAIAPGCVRLEQACFAPWTEEGEEEGAATASPLLDGVTATASPGEVVCIVGPVGCGKSALLAGIAGTLRTYGGGEGRRPLRVGGTLAWAPQGPSLFNRSLRANITAFGDREDDESALNHAVACCCLDEDALALDSGLDTVVGAQPGRPSHPLRRRSLAPFRCAQATTGPACQEARPSAQPSPAAFTPSPTSRCSTTVRAPAERWRGASDCCKHAQLDA